MSLFLHLLALAGIVTETLGAALTLITLTIGRSSPGMTKPGARSEAWKRFRYCLPSVSGAAFILRSVRGMT